MSVAHAANEATQQIHAMAEAILRLAKVTQVSSAASASGSLADAIQRGQASKLLEILRKHL